MVCKNTDGLKQMTRPRRCSDVSKRIASLATTQETTEPALLERYAPYWAFPIIEVSGIGTTKP